MPGRDNRVSDSLDADPVTKVAGVETTELVVDATVYSEEVVARVCYWFTARCYVNLRRVDAATISVQFTSKEGTGSLQSIVGEFSNELLNQRLRETIARETERVRELIVAQAFAEQNATPLEDDPPPQGTPVSERDMPSES